MENKHILMVMYILITSSISFAQTFKVSGKTLDESQAPMPFVTVLIVKAADSTIIKAGYSDESGIFRMEEIPSGKYFLKANFVGYEDSFIHFTLQNNDIDLDSVSLKQASVSLNEVTIRAKKPMFQVEADKIVVNVENSALAAGKNTLEVLALSPGLSVSPDEGSIRFKGKGGVLVLIDNRQTYMAQSDVVNFLKGLSASEVESIELISNPPAKYDAAGVAGIINVKTIKNRSLGTKGEIQAGYRRGAFDRWQTGGSLAHKTKNLAINTTANYYNGASESTFESNTQYYDAGQKGMALDLTNYRKFTYNNVMIRNSIDWDISRNWMGGTNLIYSKSNDKELKDANTHIANSPSAAGTIDQSANQTTNTSTFTVNGYFRAILEGSNHELSGDVDYSTFTSRDVAHIQNDLFTNQVNDIKEAQGSQFLINSTPISTDILVGKADFFKSLKKGLLEAGIKLSHVKTSNDAKFEEKIENEWIIDPGRTFRFQYIENISASYLSYSLQQGKNSLKAGLRHEYTHAEGISPEQSSRFKKSYGHLFPSLFYQRNLNEQNQVVLSYSRRISRPNYSNLNPFLYVVDPFTIYTGNPDLDPTLSNSFELGFTHNYRIQAGVGYSRSSNSINEVATRSLDNPDILIYKMTNLDKFESYYFGVFWPLSVGKNWEISQYLNVYHSQYHSLIGDERVLVKAPAANYNISNSIRLKRGLKLEANWSYNSSNANGLSKFRPSHVLSIALKKPFKNDKTFITLNLSDVLWTNRIKSTTSLVQYIQSTGWRADSRRVGITLVHKFGKKTVKDSAERQLSSESERSRL